MLCWFHADRLTHPHVNRRAEMPIDEIVRPRGKKKKRKSGRSSAFRPASTSAG